MAEFSEVSRGYIRMCESFGETCKGCPISACSGNDIYVCKNRVLKNPEKYEDKIMKWVAENPKLVYPTWGEWFAEKGELTANWKDLRVVSCSGKSNAGIIGLFYNEIPADIAQKLGIEPKEGV